LHIFTGSPRQFKFEIAGFPLEIHSFYNILMDTAIIYREDYVAPLPPGSPLPDGQVWSLPDADRTGMNKSQFHARTWASEWIELVHDHRYVQACSRTLDDKAMRRIGLPWSLANHPLALQLQGRYNTANSL